MNMVVVYKANPESVQTVLGLLRKKGFNATTQENPSTAAVLSGAGHAKPLVFILLVMMNHILCQVAVVIIIGGA